MNLLLLGSGGRENTLAWRISQSPKIKKLFIAPGNAGTSSFGLNVNININDFTEIKSLCLEKDIDMIVVGPEDPLVNGITDYILNNEETRHIAVVGPQKKAALLEGSKDFAKQFMEKNKIPTASYKSFNKNTYNDALSFIKSLKPPYVLKADGLAAGKGVIICSSFQQAQQELYQMLFNSKFGDAGNCVVIEEFLSGIEVSIFIATDGLSYKILPHAKDYKKIGENDKGPNTGGMGAVAPVPFVDEKLMERIINAIIEPTISGLKNENINYQGFIFIGLMIVEDLPYVIEYNVRLGDPETEVIIPLIKTDIIDIFQAICNKTLNILNLEFETLCASTVILASGGYPGDYEKGKSIEFSDKINKDCLVFHAGTKSDPNGQLVTNGGRVMAVTCLDNDLRTSLKKCYDNIEKIKFTGMYFRKDIGEDMLKFTK